MAGQVSLNHARMNRQREEAAVEVLEHRAPRPQVARKFHRREEAAVSLRLHSRNFLPQSLHCRTQRLDASLQLLRRLFRDWMGGDELMTLERWTELMVAGLDAAIGKELLSRARARGRTPT